jgi:CelD/BcsL family acetyltransferase involved in cellulose biosynthesis
MALEMAIGPGREELTLALEWAPARRNLRFAFAGYRFHETWFEGLELLTPITQIKASFDETTAAIVPLLQRHAAIFVPSHPVSTQVPPLKLTRELIRYTLETANQYYIELDGSFDQYLRRLPRARRHEIQRKLRRYLDASGGVIDLRCYSTPEEAPLFYELARRLSAKTYQDRLLGLGLPDTETFRAELTVHAERGTLRGYLLFHRDEPIAFGYCAGLGQWLRFVFTGYDAAFAARSPGVALVHEMVRSVASEGRFTVLDFGPGEAQYKRLFATTSRLCATTFFFRPNSAHLAIVLAHRACIAVSDGCAGVAQRLGVKERLKRVLRAQASSPAL